MQLMDKYEKVAFRLRLSLLNALKDLAKQYNLNLSELIRKILTKYAEQKIDENNIKDILGTRNFKEYQKLPTELDKIDYLQQTMEIEKLNTKSASDILSSKENFFEKNIELLINQKRQIENNRKKREKERDKLLNGK